MGNLVALLVAGLSQAAIAVFGKLLSKSLFEQVIEKIIIYGTQKLADTTESKLLDDVAAIVKKQLEEQGNEQKP